MSGRSSRAVKPALAAEILTAEQIKKQYAEQLSTGAVVVVQHKPRKRADGSKAFDMQLAQQSQAENLNGIAKLRGITIGGMRIAIVNSIDAERADDFPVGTELTDMKLVLVDSIDPTNKIWETDEGWRMNNPSLVPDEESERSDWDVNCDADGNPIWTQIVVRGEGDNLEDVRIKKVKTITRDAFEDWRTKWFEDRGMTPYVEEDDTKKPKK